MAYDVAGHGCIHVHPRYGALAVAVSKTVSVYLENTRKYLSNPKHTISGWKMHFHTKSCCVSFLPSHWHTLYHRRGYLVQGVSCATCCIPHSLWAIHLKNNFSLSALLSYNFIQNHLKEHAFKIQMNETQWDKYPFGWDLPHIYSILKVKDCVHLSDSRVQQDIQQSGTSSSSVNPVSKIGTLRSRYGGRVRLCCWVLICPDSLK